VPSVVSRFALKILTHATFRHARSKSARASSKVAAVSLWCSPGRDPGWKPQLHSHGAVGSGTSFALFAEVIEASPYPR
jgi:hypothetical protein